MHWEFQAEVPNAYPGLIKEKKNVNKHVVYGLTSRCVLLS